MPAVGDKVWVETAGSYEELATVLNIDVEMDNGEDPRSSKAVDGILVELFDSKREMVVSPSDITRPFRPSSPRKTRSKRQVVTPSPTADQESGKPRSKRKRATTVQNLPPIRKEQVTESPHFAKQKAEPDKPLAKKVAITKESSTTAKQPAAAKNKPGFKVQDVEVIAVDEIASSDDSGYSSGEEESDDLDRPYQVEYSTTGRATCKRCDEKIAKGALRVSHVPLFRGKVRMRLTHLCWMLHEHQFLLILSCYTAAWF